MKVKVTSLIRQKVASSAAFFSIEPGTELICSLAASIAARAPPH
jgi:hypothetical protein